MTTLIISIALLLFVLYTVLCYVIADRFGRHYAAGFGWTFIFSFFGAIFSGIILVLVSNGIRDFPNQRLVRIIGFCCLLLWLTEIFLFPNILDLFRDNLLAIKDQYPQIKDFLLTEVKNIEIDFGPMLLSGLYLLFKRY